MHLHTHINDLETVIAQCRYVQAKGVILMKEGYFAVIGDQGYMISGTVFTTDRDMVISLPELTHIANISRRLEMKLPDGKLVFDEPFLEYSITISSKTIAVSGTHHVAKYTTKYEEADPALIQRIRSIVEMDAGKKPHFVIPVNVFKQLTKKYKSHLTYHVEGEVLVMTGQQGRSDFEHFAGFSRVQHIPQFPRKSLRNLELITSPIGSGLMMFYLTEEACHVVVERDGMVYARTRMELPMPQKACDKYSERTNNSQIFSEGEVVE